MNLWLPGERIVREIEMDMYILLCSKWITNKDLLSSTWNSVQCYVASWMRGAFGGVWIHVYVWLSPFTVHLKLPQRCSSAILQYKIKVEKKRVREATAMRSHTLQRSRAPPPQLEKASTQQRTPNTVRNN